MLLCKTIQYKFTINNRLQSILPKRKLKIPSNILIPFYLAQEVKKKTYKHKDKLHHKTNPATRRDLKAFLRGQPHCRMFYNSVVMSRKGKNRILSRLQRENQGQKAH